MTVTDEDSTQFDREAATACPLFPCPACFGERGKVDDCTICEGKGIVADPEAFARHARQAAERERAEIVAWLRGKFALDAAYVIHGSHAEMAAEQIEALAHKERKDG